MSFGFSVSDFITVGQLAWDVYKSCRDAPDSFSNISLEVLSLHAVLKSVEENLVDQALSESRRANLETISSGCQKALHDLQALVDKYESLGTKSKRTFDRMGWGTNDIAELRARLTSNVVMLNTFLSTSQPTVEKKLNKLIQEFKDGKHEGSIMTVATLESLSPDEKHTWRAIRKELEEIGISVAAFDANKSFIMQWFQTAIETGAFEEQPTTDESNLSTVRSVTEFHKRTSNLMPNDHFDGQNSALQNPGAVADHTSDPGDIGGAGTTAKRSWTLSRAPAPPRLVPLFAWAPRYNASFLAACEKGDLDNARKLLARGASIDAENEKGSASKSALIRGNTTVMQWTLENGAKPTIELLETAVQLRNTDMIRLLVVHGAKPTRQLLETAVQLENTEMIRLLVVHGAKPTPKLLHLAIKNGAIAEVQLFVDHGVNIELGFHEECGPLIQAIRLGKDDVVQILLKKGAPPNAWASGYSALYEATRKGYISIVRSLMDHGAELDTRQRRDGDVALLGALREGYDEIATILIISGASIHVKSLSGLTALHVAVMSACSRSIDLLIENGLDIDPKDSCGFTPLDYAVTLPAEAIAKQLLDKGAINDHATRFNHLPILDAFPDRVWYSKMVEGYTRMRQLLRNYPHGAQDPKALYGGEKEAGHTHYSQDARPDSPTL